MIMHTCRLATCLALAGLLAGCGNKQAERAAAEAAAAAAAAAATAAKEAKIADATSAAYPSLAATATVMDWDGTVLRQGTGPYTCMPTEPNQAAAGFKSPMCMDATWMEWAHAWEKHEPFTAKSVGVSYMLAGDGGASNIDPYATAETPDNDWIVEGPHLMVLVPDPALLAGISTDPHNGGPYVMWKGTPYAHVMVPVQIPPRVTASDPVADALSAIQVRQADSAAVMDWKMKTLRKGTGPYTCMPTPPHQAAEGLVSPMCMDEPWMKWAHAWMTKGKVSIDRLGISYMLAGDSGASNIDPFAASKTDDNEWIVEGPHIMLVLPDPKMLDGIPTDPQVGGPYVMWRGTPYAHVMVPVTD